ncbi:MAG: hypothetical protein EOO01_20995, partial [Chitinophagaceae bacterium]
LRINQELYQKRKALFAERVATMIAFAKEKTGCRSVIIGSYFGDTAISDCGNCDNCLKQKRKDVSPAEVEEIFAQITGLIGTGKITGSDFFERMSSVPKTKLLKVLAFLQAENKIKVNDLDEISL